MFVSVLAVVAVAVAPAALAARRATARESAAVRPALAAYLRAQHASGARFVTYPTCITIVGAPSALAWTWLVEGRRLLDAPLPSYAVRREARWRALVFMTQNPPAPVRGLEAAAKRDLDRACRLTPD